jgi:hypothetical protein
MVSLFTGWCAAHFGILGLQVDSVNNPTLNIIGVAACCCRYFAPPPAAPPPLCRV